MDQCSRLKGLSGPFMGQFLCGKEPQFLVDQGQKFVRRFRIPSLNRVQNACDVAHACSPLHQTHGTPILPETHPNHKYKDR